MKKTRAKKFNLRMFYHLQNCSGVFLSGGVLAWGIFVWGVLLGVYVQGVFVWGFLFCHQFNQTDREVFEATLEVALSPGDVLELKSTQDIDKYADFIFTAISTAVDKAIPTSKSGHPVSQPVSEESLALIKEKCRLRQQYSQAHDPLVKTRVNQLQKEIKNNLRIESQASWEKFCNDISLETNHTESCRKIKNFLKPKGQRDYPALRLDGKPPRLMLIKGNFLPKVSKDTSAFRVTTLIQTTSMRSTSL